MTTTNPNHSPIFTSVIKPAKNGTQTPAAYQSQKMEELGYLASTIAHDFNNLLTGIMGHASLALIKLASEDDARLHIEQALKTAEYAAVLTTQLLSYSHHEHPEQEFVYINDLIQETIGLLTTVLLRNIEIDLELKTNLPRIEAIPAQLQQVIMNLVINATEAIVDTSGKIKITSGRIVVRKANKVPLLVSGTLRYGEHVYFSISDTGGGMDPAILTKIFDPFFSTKKQGRGLGLTAIQDIVNRHHGGIAVESCEGQGTTFTVFLPVNQPAPSSPHRH